MTGNLLNEANIAARAALRERRFELAETLLDERLRVDPDDVEALCLRALTCWRGGRDFAESAALLLRARELKPRHPKVLTLSAELELHFGRIEIARAFAEQAIECDDCHTSAYVALARADAMSVGNEMLVQMRMLAGRKKLGAKRLRSLHNAIGRVFDARGDYDSAFEYFSRSNGYAGGNYEPAKREQRLRQARALFGCDHFADRRSSGLEKTGCVFIVGMPRSGSTLIEQMLVAHPDIDTCHESDAVRDINHALSKKYGVTHSPEAYFAYSTAVTDAAIADVARSYLATTSLEMDQQNPARRIDKKLGNFFHLPLVKRMFPDAIILHAIRHPLDVCLSCFTQDFDEHHYANDLENLAHFYLIYMGYMRLWSELFADTIKHCTYEKLVASYESEARNILRKLGLRWDQRCAEPHRQDRFVTTASAVQVRKPINSESIDRWRNYEKHLQPLIAKLGGLDRIERMYQEFA